MAMHKFKVIDGRCDTNCEVCHVAYNEAMLYSCPVTDLKRWALRRQLKDQYREKAVGMYS